MKSRYKKKQQEKRMIQYTSDIMDEIPWNEFISSQDIDTNWKSCELLKELGRRFSGKTPDFIELKKCEHIPVFVYGTLKNGGHNNKRFLDNSAFLGRAITATPSYDMRQTPGSGFPVVFRLDEKQKKEFSARILGEVYVVNAKHILDLDLLEDNGGMYSRNQVMIKLLDQTYNTTSGTKNPIIKVWTYLGNEEFWDKKSMYRCPYSASGAANVERVFSWSNNANQCH